MKDSTVTRNGTVHIIVLASAVPHCIADTAASRASIPKAQGFDAMNRYSLTDQSRNFFPST
jgi:hypothetical protein